MRCVVLQIPNMHAFSRAQHPLIRDTIKSPDDRISAFERDWTRSSMRCATQSQFVTVSAGAFYPNHLFFVDLSPRTAGQGLEFCVMSLKLLATCIVLALVGPAIGIGLFVFLNPT